MINYDNDDIKQFLSFLNKFDNNLLIELLWYLNEHKYEEEEKMFFLESFKKIYDYYFYHKDYELKLSKQDTFIKENIALLKKTGKIKFVRDINFAPKKFKDLEPLEVNLKFGYIKDENGKVFITNSKPKYRNFYCGVCTSNKKIAIMFDEVARRYMDLSNILFHELTHVGQTGFKLPSNIINHENVRKVFQEGHAMKRARRVKQIGFDLGDIPFTYNKENNEFESLANIEYSLYRYLYFKYEILLDEDFMEKWSTNDNNNCLFEAYQKINSDYGKGIFEKLYKNTQLLLYSIEKEPVQKLLDIKAHLEECSLTYNFPKLDRKSSVINDFEKQLFQIDCQVYEMLNNKTDYLTNTIFELETLVFECLNKSNKKNRKELIDYYLYNVEDLTYQREVLPVIKQKMKEQTSKTYQLLKRLH